MTKGLPIIDLSSFGDDEGVLNQVAGEIGAACRDVGFFYVVGHGVGRDLMTEAFARSKAFFALPFADKRRLAIETIGGNRGYSGLLHEALDPKQGPDNKEAYNVGLDLEPDDPELLAGKAFRALNAWPDLPGFRETLLAYFDACAALGARIHRAFARDLGIATDFFAGKFDRPMATLAPPALSGGSERRRGAESARGRTPTTATSRCSRPTTSAASKCALARGEWIEAPAMPGAFVVNIGDCLMRWTNDVYVSTPHRVVNRSGRARYSIAFFFDPNPEAEVAAIPVLRRRGRSRPIPADPGGGLSQVPPRREQACRSLTPRAQDMSDQTRIAGSARPCIYRPRQGLNEISVLSSLAIDVNWTAMRRPAVVKMSLPPQRAMVARRDGASAFFVASPSVGSRAPRSSKQKGIA